MKKSSINTFLKLIQISLGGEFHDFPSLDTAEWQELFILAHKQEIGRASCRERVYGLV